MCYMYYVCCLPSHYRLEYIMYIMYIMYNIIMYIMYIIITFHPQMIDGIYMQNNSNVII